MALAALWWAFVLMARVVPWTVPYASPPTLSHSLIMGFGFMPLFFTGFLFTAGPRWLRQPEGSAQTVFKPVLAMLVGWALLLLGTHWNAGLAACGVGLVALAWAVISARFTRLVRTSQADDRLHATLIAVACGIGVVALTLAAVGLAMGEGRWVRLAVYLGLWWFVAPVYAVVAHRMIPFFTAAAVPFLDAWRPNWLLWTLLFVLGLQGCWAVAEPMGVVWSPTLSWVHVLASGMAGVGVMALAVRWGLVQSLRIRLLAMLHLGFVWLGVALLLDAVSTLGVLTGSYTLGLAPLHALTMGFMGSVLLAMATRVSCGHGGRVLAADNIAWTLFWVLQAAVVMRLLGALWLAHAGLCLAAAALVWAAAVSGWAVRYGRWFGRPRLDGRRG